MSQINIPAWIYAQNNPLGVFSTLIIDLEAIQQNVVTEKPSQPANMTYPLNGVASPNQPSVTPDLPLGEILVYLDGWHFRPEQASSARIFIAKQGGGYTSYSLPPAYGQLSYRFTPTKAMIPTTGTYQVYVEIDYQGDQYISNYGVLVINKVPLP